MFCNQFFLFLYFFFLILFLPFGEVKAEITDVSQEVLMPGLIHHRFIKHLGRGPVLVNILEIDMQKGFALKPALAQPNTIWAKATLTQIVRRESAVAGINANYFNNHGMPIGSLAIDKEWITGPVFKRASASIDKDGKLYFARPSVSGKLSIYRGGNNTPLSASFPSQDKRPITSVVLDSINQPDSLNGDGICFYNHWWQDKVLCGGNRACVLIDGNGIVRMKVNLSDSVNPIYPTRTDYVLSARSDELLSRIFTGDKVALSWTSTPDWSSMQHVIGGGPYLISKGEIILNDALEGFTANSGIRGVAPRTALGITSVGRLVLITADGRQKNSVGLSLWELAALLKEIGVYEAINLDGGGSTTMVANDKIINSPSDSGGPRQLSTALLLYKSSNFQKSSIGQ